MRMSPSRASGVSCRHTGSGGWRHQEPLQYVAGTRCGWSLQLDVARVYHAACVWSSASSSTWLPAPGLVARRPLRTCVEDGAIWLGSGSAVGGPPVAYVPVPVGSGVLFGGPPSVSLNRPRFLTGRPVFGGMAGAQAISRDLQVWCSQLDCQAAVQRYW